MAFDLPPLARRLTGASLLALVVGLSSVDWSAQRSSEVSAPEGARRVISLVPAVTEMIFEMGGGSRLVGVSSFDAYPPGVERLTRVGGLLDPDLERIFALRPDLVIVYGSQDELRDQLARAKIATFNYRHGGLAEVTGTMRAVGALLGLGAEADQAASTIEKRLEAVRARVAGRPRPRTLLVFGRERGALRAIYASGGRGFLHDLLELAGGDDVLAQIDRENVQTSTELILGLAPEVIIEIHADPLSAEEIEKERRVWDALAGVPAVRNGRVHILSGQELVVAGPRVVRAAERLERVLHGE
jgi:iron complex transport system substrate-binding protein